MLVLMRYAGQRVVITLPDGREVSVEVTDVRHKQDGRSAVWLGVTAPADVPVDREEILAQRRWLGAGRGSPAGGEAV